MKTSSVCNKISYNVALIRDLNWIQTNWCFNFFLRTDCRLSVINFWDWL